MDINEIISECDYGKNIRVDSDSSYKNTHMLESVYYANRDKNICNYIQMLYNINSGPQFSRGSSYEYTLDSSFNDEYFDNREVGKKHLRKDIPEYFSIESNDDKIFNTFFNVLIFCIILFFLFIVMNKSWKYYRTYNIYYL